MLLAAGKPLWFLSFLTVGLGLLSALPAHAHPLLMKAAARGDTKRVVMLLDQGVDVNVRDSRNGGVTALHLAARHGHLDTVRTLLDRGAEINATVEKRSLKWSRLETPLEATILQHHVDVAKLLVERGADVNFKNHEGDAPLHLAVRTNNVELARLLLEHGASLTETNREDLTALQLAQKVKVKKGKQRADMVTFLREAESGLVKAKPGEPGSPGSLPPANPTSPASVPPPPIY